MLDTILWWLLSNIVEICIATLVIGFAWACYVTFCKTRLKKLAKKQLNFNADFILSGENGTTALALDDTKQQMLLLYDGLTKPLTQIVAYTDLVDAEVVQFTNSVSRTSRSSQLGGGAVGFALFGGLGALVGGLSAKSKQEEYVTQMFIKLTLKDMQHPTFAVCIMNGNIKSGGLFHSKYTKTADEWLARLKVICQKTEN